MAAHPEMVAGPGRFTTALIAATAGRVVGKEGAKGSTPWRYADRDPLGVALKFADGAERCRDIVVLELLQRLGAPWTRPSGGRSPGSIRPSSATIAASQWAGSKPISSSVDRLQLSPTITGGAGRSLSPSVRL